MEDHHHHHPAAGSALRVRLVFNEADFDLGELQRTWLLVPPSAKRVSDLGRLICDKFNLKPEEWEQGILFEMEGFSLPSAEPIVILRDNDTITVRKKTALSKRRRDSPVASSQGLSEKANSPERKKQRKETPEKGEPQEPDGNKKQDDEDESSSSDEEEKGESTSSSSSSSSEEEDSSSSSSGEEGGEEKEATEQKKAAEHPQEEASTVTKPEGVTPTKGHVRFGPDGEVQQVDEKTLPQQQQQQQQQQFRWDYGRGRGRGRGRGAQGPPTNAGDTGRGRGRGRGRGQGRLQGGIFPHYSPGEMQPGLLPSPSEHTPPPPTWSSDLAYASEFASLPSPFAANGHDARHHAHQTTTLYSPSLDWKKDTHPSYSPLPPPVAPKDYSAFPSFPTQQRNPRSGDVIAYKVLEMKDGGPSYSAHKEATVESYDTATSVVSLRANSLASVPLDGSFVASEEERSALFQNSHSLAWEQLTDIRLLSS